MKLIFEWREGRSVRRTEIEIPKGLSWGEAKEYVLQAYRKALKYSEELLPTGVEEGEL